MWGFYYDIISQWKMYKENSLETKYSIQTEFDCWLRYLNDCESLLEMQE